MAKDDVNPWEAGYTVSGDADGPWNSGFSYTGPPVERSTGIIGTIASGAKGTMRGVGAAADLYQGDNEELGAAVRAQQAERKDPRLEAFMAEIAAWKKGQDDAGAKPDWIDTAKALGSAAWNNPAGAGLMIAEQLPNSVVSLGAGYGGMKTGGILGGAVAGIPGAAAGAVIGGLAGFFGANTALETGNKAIEARQAGPLSDEQRSEVMGEGARKGAVITGIDALTLGATNIIGKATTRAVEAATAKTLTNAGVNISDKAAVMAARQDQALVSAVQAAQKTAADATTTLGQRAMRTGGQAALETFGEGAGEYLGEYAASGELDKMEALIEAFSSAGTSAAEIALTKTWGNKAKDAAMWGDAPPPPELPATPPVDSGPTPETQLQGIINQATGVARPTAGVNPFLSEAEAAAQQRIKALEEKRATGNVTNILSAPDVDSAIAAFTSSLTGADMGGIIGQANPLIAPARAMQAQAAADVADLADLAQTETRDLNTLRAQLDQESRKQVELDAIQATGTGQYGIQPEARPAVEQAATVEAPTAMQLAMQRAKAAVIPNQGQPLPMTEPKPAEPAAPVGDPRIPESPNPKTTGTRLDGAPFKSLNGAEIRRKANGQTDTHDIVQVEGGFVVQPKPTQENPSVPQADQSIQSQAQRQEPAAAVAPAVEGVSPGQPATGATLEATPEGSAPGAAVNGQTDTGAAPTGQANGVDPAASGVAVPTGAAQPVSAALKPVDQRLVPLSKRGKPSTALAVPQRLQVTFGGKTYPVKSIEDAQAKWVKFQESADGGDAAGVSQIGNGVNVTDQDGKFVAKISFNGRVWDGEGMDAKEIAPADPRLVPVSKREPLESDSNDAARAKEDLKSAVADLGNILSKNTRATLVPEQEQKIMPALVRLFDAAARMGYQAFRDAVKYVVQRLRFALGPKVADQISQEELEQAHGQTMFARSETEKPKQSDEDADDSRESITQAEIPESVDQESTLEKTLEVAKSRVWNKGRDLKVAIQEAVQAAARAAGVDVGAPSDSSTKYLARVGVKDALLALKQNANAVGWYDLKTRQALSVMSLVHPELATDPDARLAFVWAMAVTSNGLKVNKNFEIAEKVYREYKATGSMPNNLGIGTAAGAINDSLDLFNELRTKWGPENLRKFMLSDFTVSEITGVSKALKPGGEHADVTVKGAAILGPKIGNGFFSNLYGNFDSLTMDRWLVRTWGRWTGTLISPMPKQTAKAEARLSAVLGEITSDEAETARLSAALGKPISAGMSTADLSKYVQEASMDPATRKVMNETETGAELRKAGNGLAKYLDGQKEAPAGPTERKYIRKVFGQILSELRKDDQYKDLSMADLQAVLWYAEKRLYESAKQDTAQDDDVDGYSDDDAPDYANAASAVARAAGVSDRRIQNALKKESDRGRTTDARRADVQEGQGRPAEQGPAGGFTGQEKREFITWQALKRIGSDRLNSGQPSWAYEGRSPGDAGLLRRLKDLGVSYIAEWSLGKKAKSVFAANGLKSISLFELAPGDANNAQKFSDAITASKTASPFGAAVYVYPTKSTDSETGYGDMRLFMSKDGKNGVAVKANGDIVSVFSAHQSGNSLSLMQLALAAGGRKLDAFDTVLPSIYSMHGFRVVARTNWNDEFAPDGWDKDRFAKFNGGEPDVVFMAYDPSHGELYKAQDGKTYDDYDKAAAAQQRAVNRVAKDVPKSGPVFARSTPFYSALTREVGKINAKAQSGGNWLLNIQGLVKAGKVKADEVEWSGVTDFLKLADGKVTKEQVTQFLDANGVKVDEVTLAGPGLFKDVEEAIDYVAERYAMTPAEVREDYGYTDEQDYIDLARSIVDDKPDQTKYGRYQLPGSTNYREVLLTLPAKQVSGVVVPKTEDGTDGFAIRLSNGRDVGFYTDRAEAEEAVQMIGQPGVIVEGEEAKPEFRSTHWNQPNVLAHIRVNDRVDAEGKRVLFVEEIQSDFGQSFKKQKDAIGRAVDDDFTGIIERMKKAGVLSVECD